MQMKEKVSWFAQQGCLVAMIGLAYVDISNWTCSVLSCELVVYVLAKDRYWQVHVML